MSSSPDLLDFRAIKKLIAKHCESKGFNARDRGLIASASLAHWGPIDLALIKVSDLVSESGSLVVDGFLPAEYSAFDKPRYFVLGKETYFSEILKSVINWRVNKKLGTITLGIYSGLNPDSKFFLQDNGEPFKNIYRPREGKKDLVDPYEMRRHFSKFYLGEGVTHQTLNDAFIMNYWVESSPSGSVKTVTQIQAQTGLHPKTIKEKCAREETTIKDVLENIYR